MHKGKYVFSQLLDFLDKDVFLRLVNKYNVNRYVKQFTCWNQLAVLMFGQLLNRESLRDVVLATQVHASKAFHLGFGKHASKSTLSDANNKRDYRIFEEFAYRVVAEARACRADDIFKLGGNVYAIDSTTIELCLETFKWAIYRKNQRKGGIKVHSVIHANEGVPCDVQFTSAATNDSFMLAPSHYNHNEIVALDRAYINYAKFEELTDRGVVYVTKMKKNLSYEILVDCMHQNPEGLMECRVQHVIFHKHVKDGEDIEHHARIITYVDIKNGKARLVSLLTNDMNMEVEDIVGIYRKRWEIELLFKQLKQNFPLRYFYGESANAIKIQIWVTLIANLLLMVMQRRIKRSWSFSNLATMFRIMLMYYVNCYTFFEHPERDWLKIIEMNNPQPDEPALFD